MHPIHDHTSAHPLPEQVDHVQFAEAPSQWNGSRIDTARRLIKAFKATEALHDTELKVITDNDLWTSITRDNFGQMLAYIKNDDAEQLARFLHDFGSSYVWFGGISTGVDGYNHWNRDQSAVALSYYDRLICLAEGLGVLPAENPEQGASGNWGKNMMVPPDEVALAIEEHLGIRICPPPGIIPVAGIQLRDRILHYRHINALYTASRVASLVGKDAAICEFGGGLGLVAYYLREMGYRSYTLFDIPITNVLSSWFLIGALGENAVSLEGEEMRPDTIKVRANWMCASAQEKHFALTLNQDSFPEINRRIFDAYIWEIQRTTSQYFLSINHEVEHPIDGATQHLNVSKLLAGNSSFSRLYRAPYWVRRGYVEELYQLDQLQYEVKRQRYEIEARQSQIEHLENSISALKTSTSWRVTAPLRAIRRIFH